MDAIQFMPSAVSALTQLVLGLVVTGLLLRIKQKTTVTRWLIACFAASSCLFFVFFASSSLVVPERKIFSASQWFVGLFAIVALIQFAYHFPQNDNPRESKWVLIVSSFCAFVSIKLSYDYAQETAEYRIVTPSVVIMSVMLITGVLWAIAVVIRHTLYLSKLATAESGAKVRFHFLRPQGRKAQASQAFALALLSLLSICFFLILVLMHVISVEFYVLTNHVSILVFLFIFVMVYLNNATESTTFMLKLMLSMLVTVLTLLGVLGYLATPTYEQSYDNERALEVSKIKLALATNSMLQTPATMAYVLARPADEGANGTSFTTVFARDTDFSTKPIITELEKAAKEYKATNVTTTAARNLNMDAEIAEVLPENIHVFRVPDTITRLKSRYVEYSFTQGNRLYSVGFDTITYYQYFHQRMIVMVILVLVTTFLILTLFPHIFRAGLIKPLESLLAGVKQVNSGDLNVVVPVHHQDEIGFLAQSFNSMVDSLGRANRLKDEFLANTSHELRTPLNGIIGLAESMLDSELTANQKNNLNMIAVSGRRLSNLINDILDFSKMKHHELELQRKPVSLHTLSEVVLALSQPLVGKKDLKLVNNIPVGIALVEADENRLQQILYNLVGNAIKFTHSGVITVDAQTQAEMLAVSVSDTGIGIAPDKFERIFESFEQADGSTAREYGGTGLGLAVTKQLVTLHGGEVAVNSTVGQGSCFSFTLPISTVQEAAPTSVLSKVHTTDNLAVKACLSDEEYIPDETNYTILIVDDEPINLQVLTNHLSPLHYNIYQASSGQEALQQIEDGLKPDLVILDVMMPRMSGYAVCEKIREMYPAHEVPVVMLTAKNQIADLMEGFDCGANDYMVKPFSKNELLARIKTHLQVAKMTAAYGRFVPQEILHFLEKESILDVKLGDQVEKEMTVLFADMRSFTTLSETMSPKESFDFVSTLLNAISPVVRQHNGFIDKYIGDAVMALFPNSADDALEAALAIQVRIDEFNKDRVAPIKFGVGLHTGMLVLGTVGEAQRMEGTVISDAVNIASRLEGLTKEYDANIIISEQTQQHLSDASKYKMRLLGKANVKGKKSEISIMEVLGTNPSDWSPYGTETVGRLNQPVTLKLHDFAWQAPETLAHRN